MEFFTISLLNGLSYGLLLFMLSSGLTLIFSMMGVLNFAHASFYMAGAYLAYLISGLVGYWPALVVAPIAVGLLGALFEQVCLRRVHRFGHVAELLVTFGLSYLVLEVVQLIWGRSVVPYGLPEQLQGPLFSVYGTQFPKSRAFIMLVAVLMLLSIWLVLTRTRIGLVIQAALTHPDTVQAGLAGVVAGNTYVTEPAMAYAVGPIIFVVVVVGGMGSLAGAFLASILIGVIQTFAVAIDKSLGDLLAGLGMTVSASGGLEQVLRLTVAQVAPILPYLFMVLILIFRPKGLLGTRET